MKFEMLLLDPGKQTEYADAASLLYGIRSLSKLWINAKLSEENSTIEDGSTVLQIVERDKKTVNDTSFKTRTGTFLISLTGEFEAIKQLRLPIVKFVEERKFKYIYY